MVDENGKEYVVNILAKNEVKKTEKKVEISKEETPKLEAANKTVAPKKKIVKRRRIEGN